MVAVEWLVVCDVVPLFVHNKPLLCLPLVCGQHSLSTIEMQRLSLSLTEVPHMPCL